MSTPHSPQAQAAATSSSALDQQAAANAAQNVANVDPTSLAIAQLSDSITALTKRVTALEQQSAALMKHSHPIGVPYLGGIINMPDLRAYFQGQQHGFLGADTGSPPPDLDNYNMRILDPSLPNSTSSETGPPTFPSNG